MPQRYANGHIFATAHSIHLYSARRAVIFAMAQLSYSMIPLSGRQTDRRTGDSI